MASLIKKIWLPVTGSVSSLTLSATEAAANSPQILQVKSLISSNPLIDYFLIGVAGALGGLVVKVVWGLIKKTFPKIKDIDK